MRVKITVLGVLILTLATLAVPAIGLIPTLNLLITGRVELKRPKWLQFLPVGAPQRLDPDDQVRSRQAGARVLCSSLRIRPIPTGRTAIRNVCPQRGKVALRSGSSRIGRTRGGTNPLIPYIISPRKTAILEDKPLLRWNAIPNATRYTVRLRGPIGVIWQTEVTQPQVRYPGKPVLQPAVSYALVVQADTGVTSTDEGIPGLGFRLLSLEEANRIKAEVEQIAQQNLTNEAEVLALAYLYNGEGLTLEAIQALEIFLKAGNRSTTANHLLGDLYLQTKLNLRARDYYLKAVDQALATANPEALVEVQDKLGEVYVQLRQREKAIETLRQARAGYVKLEGEQSDSVKKIDNRLAELGA